MRFGQAFYVSKAVTGRRVQSRIVPDCSSDWCPTQNRYFLEGLIPLNENKKLSTKINKENLNKKTPKRNHTLGVFYISMYSLTILRMLNKICQRPWLCTFTKALYVKLQMVFFVSLLHQPTKLHVPLGALVIGLAIAKTFTFCSGDGFNAFRKHTGGFRLFQLQSAGHQWPPLRCV